MDDKQADRYSTIMGVIEGSLESVGAKLTTNVGKSLLKKNIKGALLDYGLDVAENFLEEAVVEPISELVAQTTGGKDKANWENIRKRFLQSGIDGAVTSLITGGVAGTIGGIASRSQNNQATKQNILPIKENANVNEYRDYYTNKKVDSNTNKMLNEAQKLIDDNASFNTPINSKFLETARNNNIDINSNDIQNINRVLAERNINGSFDAELFNNSSQSALWRKTKDGNGNMIREVVFNPNADTNKTIQNLTIHELIHDFEDSNSYTQLKDLVLSFDKTKTGYEEARKALVETYSKVYNKDAADFNELIDNETVADILGNKLGDQEFINNLTMQDRTLGQKIYDWVVDKLNKINKLTGYKNEKLYWTDVKNKFENAFKQQYTENNSSLKYSIKTDNNGNQYIKVDTDQDIFEGIDEKDYTKIAKMYMQDYLRGETTLNKSDTTTIDNKGINKYTNPKQQTKYISEKMKLTPELKNVLEVAKKETISLPTKENSKYKSWEYYKFNFELGGKNFEGTINIGIDKNGNKHFYEINKIHTTSNSSVSTNKSSSMDSINNSIAPLNKNVNTTKYSMQESENNTQLSEEAKKQLHKYVYMDTEQLNKAFSEAVENKENMLIEYNALQKEYKEFQKTEEFKNALNDFVYSERQKAETTEIMDKSDKYANKLRYYNEQYEKYKGQQEAINSLLMGNEKDTRSSEEIVEQAEKHFGTTTNFKETAYIDINGKQIDFSGKHEGGPSGARTLDHRQINEIDTDMDSFIAMGNIRILPEGGGINLKIEPNLKQYSKLREYIDSVDGEIYIDIDRSKYSYDSAEYKKGTSASKIINDLQYYFKNGEFPKQSELAQFRYSVSKNNQKWQQYLEKNYRNIGTGKTIKELKLPLKKDIITDKDYQVLNKIYEREGTTEVKTSSQVEQENKVAEVLEKLANDKKTLNPIEISKLTQEDASTTPKLNNKNYQNGDRVSSFYRNVTKTSEFLNEGLRQEMSKEENIQYYKGITNVETLEKAYNKLKENGQSETNDWYWKKSENANAEDVAKGWILLKQYQDVGDYENAVKVAKKMRDIGTTAGQTVQAYNILSRLTPEGMFYYAQSELNEAYNKMVQGKSKEWIEKNQSNFDLTPEETQSILDIMQDVSKMQDGYDKKVKLAEVQKIITDKIPTTKSQSLKAWMRISMLFNPKTQVRNIAGNTVILPINMFSDSVSAGIDRMISKKTGVRTTGNTSLKSYAKGFGKGLRESYNDFRKGINTRNIEGNRFEVTEGKSFKNKGIGKALNRVDNILSFMLDAGDRGFYEAAFTNSINNQLTLNKTTEVTQDMIDIATNEALQRTWQDNNAYTNTVLGIRKKLNFGKGYGLGDVLIPFAKTPANLTKAIVDYSPVRLVKVLATDVRKLNNSLENGQYTPQLQHKVVQNIGKGMAGSFLYVLGCALASAGIASGEADDDKDVKNFMKNSLGINSYSIKIGDKTFSYDWAQPIATPIAIMSNYVKYRKDNPDANVLEKFWKSMSIGTEQLLEQSFMQSLNTVLNGSGTTLENLSQAILELPARAIPTLSKQIADMVDGTQRISFEYGKPFKSAVNSVIAKIPIASKTLPVSRDTLGNEIQKYGGENNIFNVMFNPANTNKGQLSKSGKEIYDVYMETGDTTIFPRTAPYYINSKGEKVTMTSEQRSEFQKVSGDYVENTLNSLLNNKDYKKLTDEQKASVINEIVSDSYSKAKYDVLKIDSKEYEKLRKILESVKANSYYDYKFKTEDMKKDSEKTEVILNANYTDKEKRALYENYVVGEGNETYEIIKKSGLNINSYMAYKLAESNGEFASDKKEDGTVDGKSVSGSAKKKTYEYVNKMNATYEQKLLLLGMKYSLTSSEKSKLANYVNRLKITKKEKLEIYDKLSGFTVYKDGKVTW